MTTNDQLTTRWIRLQREAARAVKAADSSQAAIVPFADDQPAPAVPAPAPVDEDDFGLERLVLGSWRAFFERFRPDEAEFERPHYLAAGQIVEERLTRLGPSARPDLITCRMVIDLLRQFEEARFRDFSDRVGELIDTCQQLKAQLDVAELSKCYQEDELLACQRLVTSELARRGIDVHGPGEIMDPSPSTQFKALLAHLGAQVATGTITKADPSPVAGTAVVAPSASVAGDETLDIDARDSLEWTKLHSAAFYGKGELITLLLNKGADINARAKDGATPLHLAVKRSQLVAIKLLFARGANLAAKDQEGNAPLHLAAELFTIEVLKVLTDLGATVNARNNDAWTPLHLAANKGKREIVEFLIAAGADINAVAGNGWTPLKVAANCGHLQLSEYLRSQGARQ